MSENNVVKLAQPGVFTDSLTEILRSGFYSEVNFFTPGALAYLSGRMPGAPIPHTEIAAKGHAIAEMLFAIEPARAP